MHKVGIVGLGRIAAGYSKPDELAPYTHVGGIQHSKKVALAAVADISAEALAAFRSKWGKCFSATKYYGSLKDMLDAEKLDILTVCTRGPHHHAVVLEAIRSSPKAIFLEKPATCSLAEMDEIVAAAKSAKIPITVSYSRHWGPHILRMAKLVADGLIGKVTSVVGYCGGPFLSFSSHTTDMLCQFAGYCPAAVFACGAASKDAVPDGYEAEPSLLSMIVEFKNGVVGTQLSLKGDHDWFCCEVTGTEGRAVVPFYGTPAAYDKQGKTIAPGSLGLPGVASPFQLAYDQIAAHVEGGPRPDCTGEDFVAVHEIGFAGIESVLTRQRMLLPNINRTRRVFANG